MEINKKPINETLVYEKPVYKKLVLAINEKPVYKKLVLATNKKQHGQPANRQQSQQAISRELEFLQAKCIYGRTGAGIRQEYGWLWKMWIEVGEIE